VKANKLFIKQNILIIQMTTMFSKQNKGEGAK